MLYRFLADAVVVFHALFIVFTVLGGLLVLRWPRLMLLHLPAAAWGVIVQVVVGGRCPLTPLENYLRTRGHEPGIGESFIDHYITSLIYVDNPPAWLHPVLGTFVLTINLAVYGTLVARWSRGRHRRDRQQRPTTNAFESAPVPPDLSPLREPVAVAKHT